MFESAPVSVVIPTLNAAASLPATLAAFAPAAFDGFIRELIVSDGGSTDATLAIAEEAGARVVGGKAGRGLQLARGAAAARGAWLLFLHADTTLGEGWFKRSRALHRRRRGSRGRLHAQIRRSAAGGVDRRCRRHDPHKDFFLALWRSGPPRLAAALRVRSAATGRCPSLKTSILSIASFARKAGARFMSSRRPRRRPQTAMPATDMRGAS